MPRWEENRGLTASDLKAMEHAVIVAERAGYPLRHFLSVTPARGILPAPIAPDSLATYGAGTHSSCGGRPNHRSAYGFGSIRPMTRSMPENTPTPWPGCPFRFRPRAYFEPWSAALRSSGEAVP